MNLIHLHLSASSSIYKGKPILGISGSGVITNGALVWAGKQTPKDALINTGINAGILIIGNFCPPLGVALGVGYLIYSFIDKPNIGYIPSYQELHGSIAPADNTRVHNPYRR